MSLDAYARPGVSTNIEPVLGARLLKLLEYFGGRVMIDSGYRSRAQQQKLYDDWIATGKTSPPSVAVPGTSKHERNPAEAADLHRTDPDLMWGEVHYTAAAMGLCFPINREDWHAEVDPAWIEPELPVTTPEPLPLEVDMIRLVVVDDPAGAQLVLGAGTLTWIASGTLPPIYDFAHVPSANVTVAQVHDILRTHQTIGQAPGEGALLGAW